NERMFGRRGSKVEGCQRIVDAARGGEQPGWQQVGPFWSKFPVPGGWLHLISESQQQSPAPLNVTCELLSFPRSNDCDVRQHNDVEIGEVGLWKLVFGNDS